MNTFDGSGAVRLAAARFDAGGATTNRINRTADEGLRVVLSAHRPSPDGASCTVCGFAYTSTFPLCPAVADALRELSAGDARMGTAKSPLGRYTTSQLRAIALEHTGRGRCQRCGFVYTGQVLQCPTARRIAAELESRGKAPVTQPHVGQGLCAGKGVGWTVSGKEAAPWKRAMAACSLCPLLAQCEAGLASRLAAGEKVREQVMAGRLFTVTGREIAANEVDAYAVARGRRKPRRAA